MEQAEEEGGRKDAQKKFFSDIETHGIVLPAPLLRPAEQADEDRG